MNLVLMKKRTSFLFTVFAAAIILGSCSSSKNAAPTVKRKELKGTWVLDKVTYDGLPTGQKFNITLLDEGYADCLKGSIWNFPNNGFGSYTIVPSAVGCTPGERKINWSYRTEGDATIFQFKRLEEGVKAKKITDGYKLKIVEATDTNMQLQANTTVDGNMVNINYLFVKAN